MTDITLHAVPEDAPSADRATAILEIETGLIKGWFMPRYGLENVRDLCAFFDQVRPDYRHVVVYAPDPLFYLHDGIYLGHAYRQQLREAH